MSPVLDLDALLAAVRGVGPRIPAPAYEVVFRPDGTREIHIPLSREPLAHEQRFVARALSDCAHSLGIPLAVATFESPPGADEAAFPYVVINSREGIGGRPSHASDGAVEVESVEPPNTVESDDLISAPPSPFCTGAAEGEASKPADSDDRHKTESISRGRSRDPAPRRHPEHGKTPALTPLDVDAALAGLPVDIKKHARIVRVPRGRETITLKLTRPVARHEALSLLHALGRAIRDFRRRLDHVGETREAGTATLTLFLRRKVR